MWLLNTTTLAPQEFTSTPPDYAILSHTWSTDELTFQDIGVGIAEKKAGFQKVKDFCAQARADDIEWAWVDTCCIDKTNSAQLSEAINSMFQWYSRALVCYAYLADFDLADDLTFFEHSRWFKRGWTLQELLAPMNVVFFDKNWSEIGTKMSLEVEISCITNVPQPILLYPDRLGDACVAEKMSWASGRVTTREEDRAYSLMGLFGVHMPLIYGEGENAFRRLQLEILGRRTDQTIFAWENPLPSPSISGSQPSAISVLAKSPDDFSSFRHERSPITPCDDLKIAANNQGLQVSLPVLRAEDADLLVLNYRVEGEMVCIPVMFSDNFNLCYRIHGLPLVMIEESAWRIAKSKPLCLSTHDLADDRAEGGRVDRHTSIIISLQSSGGLYTPNNYSLTQIFGHINGSVLELTLSDYADMGWIYQYQRWLGEFTKHPGNDARKVQFELPLYDEDVFALMVSNQRGATLTLAWGSCNGRIWTHERQSERDLNIKAFALVLRERFKRDLIETSDEAKLFHDRKIYSLEGSVLLRLAIKPTPSRVQCASPRPSARYQIILTQEQCIIPTELASYQRGPLPGLMTPATLKSPTSHRNLSDTASPEEMDPVQPRVRNIATFRPNTS